jgi:hypothetical protein
MHSAETTRIRIILISFDLDNIQLVKLEIIFVSLKSKKTQILLKYN